VPPVPHIWGPGIDDPIFTVPSSQSPASHWSTLALHEGPAHSLSANRSTCSVETRPKTPQSPNLAKRDSPQPSRRAKTIPTVQGWRRSRARLDGQSQKKATTCRLFRLAQEKAETQKWSKRGRNQLASERCPLPSRQHETTLGRPEISVVRQLSEGCNFAGGQICAIVSCFERVK